MPFGHGYRCVDAGGVGIFRLLPPELSDGSGQTSRTLDFTLPPLDSGSGQAIAGSVVNFQYWYRKPAAGPPNFNCSDALLVTFCPRYWSHGRVHNVLRFETEARAPAM